MKKRLDQLLVEQGHVTGRDRAKSLIMAGQVYVNGQKADKAGDEYKDTDAIEVRGERLRYVSRGGLKLEKAMTVFPISLNGKLCCDFGASTGGFTDCMLQNGAQKVFAFDVGYGQLAWSLRNDPRVVNFERTNIRYLTEEHLPDPVDFISIDVSFISLSLILPVAWRFLRDSGEVVALIKPQFESQHDETDHGIVRDEAVRLRTVDEVRAALEAAGFECTGVTESPITGHEGNVEYLVRAIFQG